MAYINVAEWSPDQVTDWLKGLDNSMYKYIISFTNNEVKGQELLNIRPYELEQLGMYSIGHQEIVLEAVEQLRNFNYHLDKENLQFLALHAATTAKCLHKQLAYYCDKSKIETQILNDITRAIATIKPLVGWLDRSPFQGQLQFNETRKRMLHLGIEMATSAQRDRFVENPVDQIRLTAEKIAKLADYIIQDISDPMILQPSTLNLVTLKKRESELGFNIVPNYHGIHVITDIKYNSPAHTSGKIEDGDEIVQINYQTVIGWQYKKVIQQLQESAPDVLITLKKRPKHTKIYGQIYMKPYRLPSKKKTVPYRLGESLPSPRTEQIPTQNFPLPLPLACVPEKNVSSDSDSSCSDILTPTEPSKVNDKELRLYLPKPRAVLQRRNTICGDQAAGFKGNVVFWHEHRNRMEQDSPSLRDKSVSFGFGLEMTARPTTCIGIQNASAAGVGRNSDFGSDLKGSLPEMNIAKKGALTGKSHHIDRTECNGMEYNGDERGTSNISASKPGISKVVRFDANMKNDENKADNQFTCKIDTTIVETFEPIPYVDDEDIPIPSKCEKTIYGRRIDSDDTSNSKATRAVTENGLAQVVNLILSKKEHPKRNVFTKSASAPTYDEGTDDDFSDDDESDVPPAIEPRKEFLGKTPPVPPRPKKSLDAVIQSVKSISPGHPGSFINAKTPNIVTPGELQLDENSNKSKLANVIDLKRKDSVHSLTDATKIDQQLDGVGGITKTQSAENVAQKRVPATKHFLEDCFEELELLTPPKTKNLTLKKRNYILAKRRKISLKTLEVSDIQGHLYRRTKDKHGVTYWAKLYFVLVDTALYGFLNKESTKANCLIFLSGFTVSVASEVHSKPFAFKVYHPKKTFYFAAESQQALAQWMEYIKRATLKGNMATIDLNEDHNVKDLFSETESSDEELDVGGSKFYSPLLSAKSGSNLNVLGSSKKQSGDNSSGFSTPKYEKYHLGFGSLKKFTKQNLPFTSSKSDKEKEEKKKASSDVPVPTAQFRSYRKVPGNAGMQLGTTSMINSDFMSPLSIHPFEASAHTGTGSGSSPASEANVSPMGYKSAIHRKNSTTSMGSINPQITVTNILQTPTPPIPIPHQSSPKNSILNNVSLNSTPPNNTPPTLQSTLEESSESISEKNYPKSKATHESKSSKSKLPKASAYNYIHASNPNLVEFTFQTSKTLDYSFPKINPSNILDAPHNLQGFVTLKDLMLQKQEEEAQDMYNNRVNLGVEKKNDKLNKRRPRPPGEGIPLSTFNMNQHDDDNPSVFSRPNVSKIQRRSLPKTPDYAQSFKPDDCDIIMARSKEGQKLRDFGYEFISGDDAMTSSDKKQKMGREINARLNDRDRLMIAAIGAGNSVSVSKKKALNWISTAADSKKADEEKASRGGSFKKTRNKIVAETLENFKTSSEKLFQFKYGHNSHNSEKDTSHYNQQKILSDKGAPLKPVTSYSPLTLPLNRKTSNVININLNNGQPGPSTSNIHLKKSQTTNLHDLRENFASVERKNSAPIERSASYFTKLTFSGNKTAKEKKLLGSPRLHRAIFGRRESDQYQPIDHEAFSPIEHNENKVHPSLPPQQPKRYDSSESSSSSSFYGSATGSHSNASRYIPQKLSQSNSTHSVANAEYPSIEYPPVFEPETYSLCDPNTSLTLLRRRNGK